MSRELSQRIEELAAGLTPVRRIPRLRAAAARVLLFAALAMALGSALLGVRADLADLIGRDPGFTATLAGLGLVGVGGVLAGLAAAVPGRELLARVALGIGFAGVLVPGGVTLLLLASGPVPAEPALGEDAACLVSSSLMGLPVALVALAFVARGAAQRPWLAAWAAASGAVAVGAIAVHLGCPHDGLRHVLLAHALAPVSGGLLLGALATATLRRPRAV